ncbi:MAG: succinate-semialdehyde dehydrogenase / glutarate-semialdehyde dehydrogenase [Solirubrobacteraceae bacterium]|nr:succinate-semialdehyde dehydrogenase / glutarate-semialdehyde dehydrogenase [Solirubrobacteraceae bacterium]
MSEQSVVESVPKQLYIGGKWRDGAEGGSIEVEDPSTEETIAEVADGNAEDAKAALASCAENQAEWQHTPPRERGEILRRAFEMITERTDDLALLMTLEMGKSIAESKAEIAYASEFFRWFAEEAVRIEGRYGIAPNGAGRLLTMKQPVGPCIMITPWNFPMAMGTRKIGPAIAAGCTMVIKPAKQTPLSMLALAKILEECGLPGGVLNVLTASSSGEVMEPLIKDPRARKLTFTGSTEVGRKLMEQASENLLRLSMELGGNAPFLVFEDADIDVRVGPAADFHGAHALGEPLRELLRHGLVDVEAVGRRAGLADVAHLGDEGTLDGGVEIGVVEDEERRVAAELHRHAQDLVGGLADQLAADLGGPGERQLAGARVLDERLHRPARRLGRDDVQHAAGQARLLEDLREGEHRQRRLLGRLDHHRAAGRDGGADLAGAHRQREVPRRDEDARADRLLHRQDAPDPGLVDREAAVDADGLLRVPAEEVRGVGDLRLGLGDRLAHLHRHEHREVVGALGDEVVGPAQDVAALARRVVAERLERLVRGAEGGLGVLDGRVGDLGDRLAGRGILDRDRPALAPIAPLAADVQLRLDAVENRLFR